MTHPLLLLDVKMLVFMSAEGRHTASTFFVAALVVAGMWGMFEFTLVQRRLIAPTEKPDRSGKWSWRRQMATTQYEGAYGRWVTWFRVVFRGVVGFLLVGAALAGLFG